MYFKVKKRKQSWAFEVYSSERYLESQSGFAYKAEAKAAGAERVKELCEMTDRRVGVTLPALYLDWYKLTYWGKHSVNSRRVYMGYYKKLKAFFDIPVSQMDFRIFQEGMARMGEGVNLAYLRKIRGICKHLIDYARESRLLVRDFVCGVVLFSEKEKASQKRRLEGLEERRAQYLSTEEEYLQLVKMIEKACGTARDELPFYLYFLLLSGARPAEALGLRWEDFDFEGESVCTRRRVDTSTHEIVPPKRAWAVREIPLSEQVIRIFRQWRQLQEKRCQEQGKVNVGDWVFYDGRHKGPLPLARNKELNAALVDYQKKIGISPGIGLYGCRHTRATYLLGKGLSYGAVAAYLGHKDTRELIATYGHLFQDARAAAFAQIRKL